MVRMLARFTEEPRKVLRCGTVVVLGLAIGAIAIPVDASTRKQTPVPQVATTLLTPDLLAYVPNVRPLEISHLLTQAPVRPQGLMIQPDPKTYWPFIDSDRLIAPAGASYQTSLTMGKFTGTEFGSRDFYVGSLGPEARDSDEIPAEKAGPIPKRLRLKKDR